MPDLARLVNNFTHDGYCIIRYNPETIRNYEKGRHLLLSRDNLIISNTILHTDNVSYDLVNTPDNCHENDTIWAKNNIFDWFSHDFDVPDQYLKNNKMKL